MKNKLTKVIGIISYFPDREPDRTLRIQRFKKLLGRLDQLFPEMPIYIIAQNWKEFTLDKPNITLFSYPRLGIVKARRVLREKFLESNYDYLIMLDDDAILVGEDSDEYLRQIDANPDGALIKRWEYSQLNLFAISRELYALEDMPDVDPEKDEAFEDVIFTSTLKAKYPRKLKNFYEIELEDISFRYEGKDKVPSTWSNVKRRDWGKLRRNTKRMKAEIEGKKIEIDLVVPFVDGEDPNWIEVYNQFAPEKIDNVQINGVQRFRKSINFKFLFRGVEKFAPWIRKVFLLVQQDSQVPEWINRENVEVIYHHDIIPEKHLPIFQSQAFEMYLDRIPGLSECFLYANDDMYITREMYPEDFFDGDKVCMKIQDRPIQNLPPPLWQISILNGNELIYEKPLKNILNSRTYRVPVIHGIRAYLKSNMTELNQKYAEKIDNSITKFRDNKNFNIYLYDMYLEKTGKSAPPGYQNAYVDSKTSFQSIKDKIFDRRFKVICINDTEETYDKDKEWQIFRTFEKIFPEKSKYEK